MIALEIFKKILEENGDKFPLLTLDEFFDGNSEEDSIAPNQWEMAAQHWMKCGKSFERLRNCQM